MSSIVNPYSCKPCSVIVHKLSPEFLDEALNGKIKWKGIFKGKSHRKFGTDTESYVKSKIAERKKHEREIYIEPKEPVPSPPNEDSDDKEYSPIPVGRQLRARKPKKVTILRCKECSFTSTEQESLLLHSAAHKSNCEECNLMFENKFKYQLHVYETHKPPVELKRFIVYGCKVCQHFFDEEIDAHNHLTSHADIIEGGKYACALCRSTYAKEVSLNAHLTTKHITYKCTFCDFLGSSFDILERHSLNTHAAYGKPYHCNLCDFRSSTFGALSLHRKFNHALDYDNNVERCRLCYSNLESDRESLLEHLISHVDGCLIFCTSCDYRCNSFQLMRAHGLDFHGTQDLDSFAQLIDFDTLSKAVKATLDAHYGTSNKKVTRTQPTFTETNMAIAGLNQSGYMGLDPILDSPVKVVPMESSALNIQGVMADQDPFLSSFSVLHTSLDPMISFSSSVQEEEQDPIDYATNGYSMQEFSSQSEHLNMGLPENNHTEDQDHSDPQTSVTVHPTCDPLGVAFESTMSQPPSHPQIPIPSEGILSVDPETGQLFLQGLPVYDDKGQAIYVAIHESALSTENESPTKSLKDCVQTANEESTEPVPNGEIS